MRPSPWVYKPDGLIRAAACVGNFLMLRAWHLCPSGTSVNIRTVSRPNECLSGSRPGRPDGDARQGAYRLTVRSEGK